MLTENRNTLEREGKYFSFPVLDEEIMYAGGLAAILKSTGEAQMASDTADLVVIGRVETYVDNTDDGETVLVKSGVFKLENSESHPVTAALIGAQCYVEDDQTVSGDAGSNGIVAGIVVQLDADGVWVDTSAAVIAAVVSPAIPEAATVSDPAACASMTAGNPAAMDAITAVAPEALTYSDPDAITAVNPAWGNTTTVDQAGNLDTFGAAVVADLTALRAALVAAGADLGGLRTPVAALVTDVTAAKTAVDANNAEIDKLVTDAGSLKTAVDGNATAAGNIIDALQGAGLMA